MMTASAMAENHHTARFGASILWPIALTLITMTSPLHAQQSPEPVRYTVSFPAPQSHYAEIQADFPTGGQNSSCNYLRFILSTLL